MSAINEAYARIDYSYLKELESRLQAVENEIDEISDDVDTGVSKRIVTRKVSLKDNKSSGKITFGKAFPRRPTVTFGIQDGAGIARSVVITEITTEYFKYTVFKHPGQKGADGGFTLHIVAIGDKD